MEESGVVYLKTVEKQFRAMKDLAERALAQVQEEDLFWRPHEESNSISVLMKHLSGNLRSRWTDFLSSDGEKPWRRRDEEFQEETLSREELFSRWEEAWQVLFATLSGLKAEDLLRTVTIRGEAQKALEAIQQQVYHTAYHVGQLVYLAKARAGHGWQTLTVPRRPS
ncbi:MAG: DUF1572 family protein [Bacillota bacterium]|nr:DUF1572 family protein [Bacillota bacterium]